MASMDSYCDLNLNGGKLLTAGFEEVNSLPTTNLFVGRQVNYNNSTYRYNGLAWKKIAAIADRVYPYQCNVDLYTGNNSAGAIIIKTPISSNGDNNNSMTYLEVSVYTHVSGEAVAKYLIYYYEYPSSTGYNKLSYSIIGSPVFEKVRVGYNNNNQCIVLGDFDKIYRYHVLLNVVATGFKRTTDDTDRFEIIKDTDESNYTGLFEGYGVQFAYARGFKVPNGTASQFLKADGSLDNSSYALHTDLNSMKNNAWKLDIANPECETVVIALQPGQGIFEAMEKAGIDYSKSRNIYVDLSAAGEWSGENIFAGYEKAPIGVRYHIFFGNVKTAIKLYWASSIESNKLSGNLALTAEYPTAKCEFMRVTDSWTYADWEALIDEVSHVIDTGTASESDNSTLTNYMDNNKISYTKTTKGALVNITALLAALAGTK